MKLPPFFLLLLSCLLVLIGVGCDSAVEPETPLVRSSSSGLLRVAHSTDALSAKTGYYANDVVMAEQGIAVPSGSIASNRSNPEAALGEPDRAFYSLGFDKLDTQDLVEGVMVLGFSEGQLLKSLTITVFEESYGGSRAALETAEVFVSENEDGPWTSIGIARNDGSTGDTRPTPLDPGALCVRYVRLVNTTDRAQYSSSSTGDGFDVNAVQIESDGVCQETYPFTGSVYVDTDEDATRDGIESGVLNVQVELTNSSGAFYATTTDATGAFTFNVPAGTYSVSVPASASGAFNESLFDNFTFTGASTPQQEVVVGAAAPMVDFGFALNVVALTQKLASGEITTSTEDARFWTHQMRHAALRSRARVQVTRSELTQYLNQIQTLLLHQPFQFVGWNRYRIALEILAPPTQTEEQAFLRELLTAELNFVSGRGSGSEALDRALLAHSESVAAAFLSASSSKATSAQGGDAATQSSSSAVAASLKESTELLSAYNSSGGGGGVGGPN